MKLQTLDAAVSVASAPVIKNVLLALLVVFGAGLAWAERGVHEDGFFILRMVDVFLHTGQLTYNPGEFFEANTDFLWTLLLIPGPLFGLDDILWMQVCGVAVYVALLLVAARLARLCVPHPYSGLAVVALLVAHVSLAHFATTGYGAVLQALAVSVSLLGLWHFNQEPGPRTGFKLGLALSFLLLCRLDSVLLALPVALCTLFVTWRHSQEQRRDAWTGLLLAGMIPTVASLALLAWKYAYYGDIFPATYYLKAALSWQGGIDVNEVRHAQGLRYLQLYWSTYWLWAVGLAALLGFVFAMHRRAGLSLPFFLAVAGVVAVWQAYVFHVGGDFAEFRFLLPQMPALMLLLVAGIAQLRGMTRDTLDTRDNRGGGG